MKITNPKVLSFRPKVSEWLCKKFFEANIICTKNLFDFTTKAQKCLWSCRMTLITSSKLTSVLQLCDGKNHSLQFMKKPPSSSIITSVTLSENLPRDAWYDNLRCCLLDIQRNKSPAEAIDVRDKQYFCHPVISRTGSNHHDDDNINLLASDHNPSAPPSLYYVRAPRSRGETLLSLSPLMSSWKNNFPAPAHQRGRQRSVCVMRGV